MKGVVYVLAVVSVREGVQEPSTTGRPSLAVFVGKSGNPTKAMQRRYKSKANTATQSHQGKTNEKCKKIPQQPERSQTAYGLEIKRTRTTEVYAQSNTVPT